MIGQKSNSAPHFVSFLTYRRAVGLFPFYLNIQPERFLHGQKRAESYLKYVSGPLGHSDRFPLKSVCLLYFCSLLPRSLLALPHQSGAKCAPPCTAKRHDSSGWGQPHKQGAFLQQAASAFGPGQCSRCFRVRADSSVTSGSNLHTSPMGARGSGSGGGGPRGC